MRRPSLVARSALATALGKRLVTRSVLTTALVASFACGGEGKIEQPTRLYGQTPISYPIQLWDQDMEGQTLLRVRVSDTGAVDSIEVERSSGYEAFDSAAVAGAREMRFSPARRDGERIDVWATVPVHFSKRPRPDTARVLPRADS